MIKKIKVDRDYVNGVEIVFQDKINEIIDHCNTQEIKRISNWVEIEKAANELVEMDKEDVASGLGTSPNIKSAEVSPETVAKEDFTSTDTIELNNRINDNTNIVSPEEVAEIKDWLDGLENRFLSDDGGRYIEPNYSKEEVKQFLSTAITRAEEEARENSEKYLKIIEVCRAKAGRENDAGVFARDILALCDQIDAIQQIKERKDK